MAKSNTNPNHQISIDLLRVITAFTVIFFHTINESYWHLDWLGYKTWIISSGLGWLFVWGVPMFILISGYLLLTNYRHSTPWSFYQRRLSRLLIPFLFWNIFYYFLNHPILNLSEFLNLLWQKGTFPHLYFLHVLFGFYLLTPFLSRFLPKIRPFFFIFLILSFIPSVFYQYARGFLNWPEPKNIFIWFIPYFPFYLTGYWLSTIKPSYQFQLNLFIAFILSSLSIFITRKLYFIFPIHEQRTVLVSANSPTVIVSSILIFATFKSLKNSSLQKYLFISRLSKFTLGIYLIHPVFIRILSNLNYYYPLMQNHYWFWLASTFLLISLFSFISTYILQKIPLISKII